MHVYVAHLRATLIHFALADFFFLRLVEIAFNNGISARDFCIWMMLGQNFAGVFAAWLEGFSPLIGQRRTFFCYFCQPFFRHFIIDKPGTIF